MRLRLFPGRAWWPGRRRGRRAAGKAARPSDARDLGQPSGHEPGQPARAPGQPGSHRKTATRGIGWPYNNNSPSQGPADGGRSSPGTQTTTTGAGDREGASRNDWSRNDWSRNGLRGNDASGTGSSADGRSRESASASGPSADAPNGKAPNGKAPNGNAPNGNAAGSNGATRSAPNRDGAAPTAAGRDGATRTAAGRNAASRAAARAAIKTAPGAPGSAPVSGLPATTTSAAAARRAASTRPRATSGAAEPWYAVERPNQSAAGFRHCGRLEQVLVREWDAETRPAPECITAVNRLADLPVLIKEKLVAGLDAIHVGAGGVPDLDDMGGLSGVPLPSGRATWDACAGAYGDRKIIVGSRPSPTPDVTCHEVGHALDDLDGPDGGWQSDGADFRALYGRCLPHLASDFHRHGETLGRREFFADAFAAIASGQRPALVEMLRGDTRTALDVMLYFNVRYGM